MEVPRYMQAVATVASSGATLGTFFANAAGAFSAHHTAFGPVGGLLVLVCAVFTCGCCCGFGWGLLLGSWAPGSSTQALRLAREVAKARLEEEAAAHLPEPPVVRVRRRQAARALLHADSP